MGGHLEFPGEGLGLRGDREIEDQQCILEFLCFCHFGDPGYLQMT